MSGWQERYFELERFELQSGRVLAPLRIAYESIGEVVCTEKNSSGAPDSSRTIVLLPSASGLKRWARAHVGPDRTFDSSRHHVVSVDAIGGGQSSRPSEGLGEDFPAYSIRDNARAIHRLLTQGLGLPKVHAIGGPSMGAMIALEMGLQFPGFASRLLLYSPSARCSRLFEVLIAALTRIARLPGDSLHAAALAYFPSLISHDYLERVSAAQAADAAELVAQSWVADWSLNDLLSRYAAVATHDIRAGSVQSLSDVLGGLTPATLLMPCVSDNLLPAKVAAEMARLIPKARLVPIASDMGHWAASQPPGTPEFDQIRDATRSFVRCDP